VVHLFLEKYKKKCKIPVPIKEIIEFGCDAKETEKDAV